MLFALGWVIAFLAAARPAPESAFSVGKLLYADDFRHGLSFWRTELERPGRVEANNGILSLDVPAGASVWFRPELRGAVMVQYEATPIRGGGPNDRVSDLNCFWMASDARSPSDLFATPRSGSFADYNQLRAYYVGQGGNANTTTRFRRYIGDRELRPLLPEHDLSGGEVLLRANVSALIQLVAFGGRIQYLNNGRLIFDYRDGAPYTHGHFALRTTFNHMEVRNFKVYRLERSRSELP